MNTINTHTQQETYINKLATKITSTLSQKVIANATKRPTFLSRLLSYEHRNAEIIECMVNGKKKSGTIKIYQGNNQSYWAESDETLESLAQIEMFEHFATFIQNFDKTLKSPIRHLVILSSEINNVNWLYKKSGVWIFTVEAVQEIVAELDRQKAVKDYFQNN